MSIDQKWRYASGAGRPSAMAHTGRALCHPAWYQLLTTVVALAANAPSAPNPANRVRRDARELDTRSDADEHAR